MSTARVLFAGTPAFARASLEAMVNAGIRPAAVWTQPDRPAGRGREITASPVKAYALEQGLAVLQPPTLRDRAAEAALRAYQPDLMVVAAYGLIFPQSVLDVPRLGCVNVHASLLPRWRGAAPIQAAILAGDAESGISLMRMEAGLDSGPVYVRRSVPIGPNETAGELHDRLAGLGGDLLAACLPGILSGALQPEPQDFAMATRAGKIAAADARLDWTLPADTLARQVRAFNPVPGARFELGGETIKCWRAEPQDGSGAVPGSVSTSDRDGVHVACGDGFLRLLEVQRPGRRRISGAEFARQLAGRTPCRAAC